MDPQKLRSLVFEKTGIRVDTTDPVFALVALNEAVLSDYAEQHAAGLQVSTEQLKEQTRQLIEAGDRAKKLLLQMGQTVEDPAPAKGALATPARLPPRLQLPALAGGTAMLTALLVLLGQAAFAPSGHVTPVSPAPAQAAAPTLTPEQIQLMQNGEKFAKLWPKLDAKTQAKMQELMQ